jgi:hypothetical protein
MFLAIFLQYEPGMVGTVDIITGHKSVLDYLLKPVLKARTGAMREWQFLAEIFGDYAGLFAGKPAPTGLCVVHK